MDATDYRSLSFWHHSYPGSLEPRPPLAADEQVDVAIVGAGYSGLWTAHYLKTLEPGLRVAIVESEIAGFGASGRNGGWVLGLLAGIDAHLKSPDRRDGAIRLQRALFETVAEVGRVCEEEGIDCHYTRGGSISVASLPAHRDLLQEDLAHFREIGFGEDDVRWLDAAECRRRVGTARNLGGLLLAHCAAIHPLRLARGLADAVCRRGVRIYERSPARALEAGAVVTDGGRLRADVILRTTEGYSDSLPHARRRLLPIHSLMIATEPLPEEVWKEIGLESRETFADPRRVVIYGQRTRDGRLAFGTRGHYYYGSRIRDRFPAEDPAFGVAQRTLESIFPVLRGRAVTHRWGGALGVPRDWRPRVGFDRSAGRGFAGGYVGEGVAASNLAARTLAELVLGRDTERVGLPLVAEDFPSWEPEPLRWLAVTAVRQLAESLDAAEARGQATPKLRAALFDAIVRK